ncbi:hypothetical protein HWV62_19911 [Athelia sp. TMB]|nr:hypothetical protein HWV62_19911 [Athelia sp. TMB]
MDAVRQKMTAYEKNISQHGEGRSIEELLKTDEILKGVEAQRLRTQCTSITLIPEEHFDELAMSISTGDLAAVQADFEQRVKRLAADAADDAAARKRAAQEIAALTWGPTRVRVYNVVGLGILLFPGALAQQLAVARWLSADAHVPPDGRDLSGTTALFHSISTHPAFQPALAQILHAAGADVNARNRYGATAAHEICMIADALQAAEGALRWFVTHGGNVDVRDSDRCTPRAVLGMTTALMGASDRARMLKVLDDEDARRAGRGALCCAFCGREDKKLLRCGRCRKAGYCEPSEGRQCQKGDWPRHKAGCTAK